jgi:hypothetical protein
LLTPGLRLLDIVGNIKKHILAPRANTQAEMNLSFQGTFYNLGERYTDLTKVLFVCFFYSALYPFTFFYGAAILFVQYFVRSPNGSSRQTVSITNSRTQPYMLAFFFNSQTDRYCLMRIWAWAPSLGGELARFSRRYFFSGALLAMAIVSSYAWAQFPYDNLCDPTDPTDVTSGFGNKNYTNVILLNGDSVTVEVKEEHDTSVVFCNQNWREQSDIFFPPTSRVQPEDARWMDDSQEDLTDVYGWTALACLVSFVLIFFGGTVTRLFLSLFRGVHAPDGQKQEIDFSKSPTAGSVCIIMYRMKHTNTMPGCVPEIFCYIPQIKLKSFPFPFLACNIDDMDQDLIGWSDPANSYDFWVSTFY